MALNHSIRSKGRFIGEVLAVLGIVGIGLLALYGLGAKVEVPTAHVAKIMTKSGFKVGTVPTSKFRLDFCWLYCDKIVLLDVSDQAITESMPLFMPKDRLNMKFDVRLTIAVKEGQYDEIFSKVPPVTGAQGDIIPLRRAYEIYAQQIIRAEAREYLSQFTIAEIASSRDVINAELSDRLSKSITDRTPFMVRYAGLADVSYPDIIVKAQENAAERREMIQQEEAQLEISKVQLERQLKEQQMQRAIDVERALAEAEVNKILADSVTPEYIKYRSLNALDKIASSENKVFVPTEMLNTVAGQVMLGSDTRRFK